MLPLYQFEKQAEPKSVLGVAAITPCFKRTIGNRRGSIFAMPVDCRLDRLGAIDSRGQATIAELVPPGIYKIFISFFPAPSRTLMRFGRIYLGEMID